IRRSKYRVIPVPAKSDDACSALLMTLPVDTTQLVYIFVLERDGPIQTRSRTDGGNGAYESLVLPTDQLTVRYIDSIRTQLGGRDADIRVVSHQVVTAEVIADMTAKDRPDNATLERAAGLFNNAIDALAGYRENWLEAEGIAVG